MAQILIGIAIAELGGASVRHAGWVPGVSAAAGLAELAPAVPAVAAVVSSASSAALPVAAAAASGAVDSILLASIGGLAGALFVAGAAVHYFLSRANAREPPAHAPRQDDMYPCPKWLPTIGQFNWGVVGESGVGKSTLINTLRGLRARDKSKGAAVVDICECTLKPTPYRLPVDKSKLKEHPNLDKIVLWDLPGCGTPVFPADTYVANMGLRHFDGIVVVTSSRFKESDLMLMKALRAFHVPFFMVRNKVDVDIEQNEEQCGIDEEVTLRTIREFMVKRLGESEDLYLVSAAKALTTKQGVRMTLDFDRLMVDMMYKMSRGRTLVRGPPYWKDRTLEGGPMRYAVQESFRAKIHQVLLGADDCDALQRATAVSVTRVENPRVFRRYFQAKERLIERHRKARQPLPIPPLDPPVSKSFALDSFVNEVWAWHGLKADSMEQILSEGFDELEPDASVDQSFSGSELSFTTEPGSSMWRTDDSGPRFLLLCRVVLGQPLCPDDGASAAGSNAADMHPLTDSVVASSGHGKQGCRDIIVHDSEQAYPEYVVKIST